ncbi:hypothetical protein [Pontibacter litorisediminis]|uniref:hypothetical protein n=1 Tax=Pontibacter litorisediminis TaxID=1846260 RepID=UPI0023EA968B|nr:hypothetical protein [Pontibacter litorisediminis]
MKKHIKRLTPYLLLLLLASCQERTEQEKGLAGTHPKLAEDLAQDSLTVPYSDSSKDKDLYNRYLITTEQYRNSGSYDVSDMYRGNLAPLDESSHNDARTYRTMLRKGLEEGVNFARKYTVVSIGCGTGCQQHLVVDRETGKVLDKVQSSMGASYSADSRLFIINPPDSAVNYEACNSCTPEAYEFIGGKFRKLEQEQN